MEDILEKVNKDLWVIIKAFLDGKVTDKSKRVLVENLNMYMDIFIEKHIVASNGFSNLYTFNVKDYGKGIIGVQCISNITRRAIDTDEMIKNIIGYHG